ncbi:MATE family efflux transporter [Chryseosolibacter indicus]|uniref:Multidrug-efflux transporter n=1 Tax=Chryseosolibacter indicus TaxID=2782351 RepID=A0ABS5VRT8_9BACT|nr:MATE family efflux transporter [Chryseosolibacter indicus]MBT1704157.1 MATE family efflux transporter [Chryseosolibacter indicus]
MTTSKVTSIFRLFKQAIKGEQQDYTKLSIDRAIFLLSIPMILEMIMESLFAVVDVYWVSQLNDNDAVATVGLTESLLTIIYSIGIGLSMGATAMVARRVGEKDIKSAQLAAMQSIYFGIGISIVITFIGIFFSESLLRWMGASQSLIDNHSGYTKWMLTGNLTILMLFLINAIFRGAGDASLAMRSLWVANILNIALGPIFIFGVGPIPRLGVEGAAIATTIGRGCGVLFQLYYLLSGKGVIKINLKSLAIRWDIIIRLFKVSAGGTGQFLIASASWIFLVRILSTFGSTAVAGYTIAIRLIVFAILPAWGMANAAATLVGQNLGAGFPDRAEKSVWRAAFLNMIFLGIVTIIFLLFARPLLQLFTDDVNVLQNGILALQVICLGYIFYAYGMVISQSFNGAGDTRTPTLINFFGFWLFQIPLAYSLAILAGVGTTGVYAAISIAESAIAVVGIIIFRKGAWKAVKI